LCFLTAAKYRKEGKAIMNFAKVGELAAKAKAMRPLSKTEPKRLRDAFIVENTYNSNAIEGNTLTLRETALILLEGAAIAEKPIREHLEAIGHRDAFEYVMSLADAGTGLTKRTIKDVHSLVLMNGARNKGAYRSVPVAILGAAHTPPQPYFSACANGGGYKGVRGHKTG
jgi:Fic family protein